MSEMVSEAQDAHSESPFTGDWIYRSFLNVDTLPLEGLDGFLFGEGKLALRVDAQGRFVDSGFDFGPGYPMRVEGRVEGKGTSPTQGHPATARFTAHGVEGTRTAGWIYQYVGYYAPTWPQGVDQVPSILGSVIRVVPHGSAPAGVVASFVAVRTGGGPGT